MKKFAIKALLAQLLLLSSMGVLWAQDDTSTPLQLPTTPRSINAIRTSPQPTADQQKENPTDRQLAQQIRKALVKDKSLSTYGHNVKVIAQNGMVTLKGPVKSDEEKQAIEAKAAQIAGSDKVTSEMQVASK